MANPIDHARSSAKKFGGTFDEYLAIHEFMDSTKSGHSDNRHRMFTHNSWFISTEGPLVKVFGREFINSAGRRVLVHEVGQQHCLEDFGGYIPTMQDWAMAVGFEEWMGGTTPPPSGRGLKRQSIHSHITARENKTVWKG